VPIAYWDPVKTLLVTVFIVAFPTIPLAFFLRYVLRQRTTRELDGLEGVRLGRGTTTPISMIGWLGVLVTAVVLVGVGLALVAQRATDSHPGNPTQRGAATNVNTTRDPTPAPQGNAAAGARVFASNGCGGCHTLKAGKARGTVGPNLDESRPDFTRVVECVTTGPGDMPAFTSKLTPAEIRNVAAFVVAVGTGNRDPGENNQPEGG